MAVESQSSAEIPSQSRSKSFRLYALQLHSKSLCSHAFQGVRLLLMMSHHLLPRAKWSRCPRGHEIPQRP
eukprot:3640748-Amphidinium_carterae.1